MSIIFRKISYQNHVACIIIQKYWRGYLDRKHLWSYGQKFFVYYIVIRIQCAWRVYKAKKRLMELFDRKVFDAAHTVQNLYYCWRSKTLKFILRNNYLKKCVIKIQSAFRRRVAKRFYNLLLAAHRWAMAIRIQCAIRRWLGICRSRHRRRLHAMIHGKKSNKTTNVKDKMMPNMQSPNLGEDSNIPSTPKELIELIIPLFRTISIVGDIYGAFLKYENLLLSRHFKSPNLTGGSFESSFVRCMSVVVKSTSWAKFGRNRLINVGLLEETIGMNIMFLRGQQAMVEKEGRGLIINSQPDASSQFVNSPEFFRLMCDEFSFEEIFEASYQLASWPSVSLLKLYDACFVKVDFLLYLCYTLHWREFIEATLTATAIETELQMRPITPSSQKMSKKAKPVEEVKLVRSCTPFFSSIKVPSVALSRLLKRAWSLMELAKKLISPGSHESFELVQRQDYLASLIDVSQVLHKEEHQYNIQLPNETVDSNVETESDDVVEAPSYSCVLSLQIVMSANVLYILGEILSYSDNIPSHVRQHLEKLSPYPLQPIVILSHELASLATSQYLYTVGKSAQAKRKRPSLSSQPSLDERRLADYLRKNMIITPSTSLQSDATSKLQPVLAMQLPYLQEKRETFIQSNTERYATVVLQRMYRGYAGRLRFKAVREKFKEIRRRWWLANKVLDKLRIMRRKHEAKAVVIQAAVKGFLWRKRLRIMHAAAILIQCIARIRRARLAVKAEKLRQRGGPPVEEMLPGGKLVEVNDHKILFTLFRCGNNYRLCGEDLLLGVEYEGILYQAALKAQLKYYNETIVEEFNGDRTSLVSKQAQIEPWQHDKVIQYILTHLQLSHRMVSVTNALGAKKFDTELYLNVNNNPNAEIFGRLQKPLPTDILNHPYAQYIKASVPKKTISPFMRALNEQKKKANKKKK